MPIIICITCNVNKSNIVLQVTCHLYSISINYFMNLYTYFVYNSMFQNSHLLSCVYVSFEMFQNCQHSKFCYDYTMNAKPIQNYHVCEKKVQGWSWCLHAQSKGEVTSPFKHLKHNGVLAKEISNLTFKGLNLFVAFDANIMPTLNLDFIK